MVESCPDGSPAQLSDGKVIMPEDLISFSDLCELMPLLLETMAQSAQAQANGGQPTPGTAVPIAGGSIFVPGSAPVPSTRPGAIVGAPSGPMQQGGGSMGFGGGGGRGAQGPPGPRGPAGPGTIEPPVVKKDGDFTVASVSPFVPIPGASITFNQESDGHAAIFIQAVFGFGDPNGTQGNGQLGLRIDGVDQPLTGNRVLAGLVNDTQQLVGVHTSLPVSLKPGTHTVEVVVRGDAAIGVPTGNPVTVQANSTVPLALTVIHQ